MNILLGSLKICCGATRNALILLAACPTLVWAASENQVPIVVTLQLGVTDAEIQQALDNLPAGGGEVVLPPGQIVLHQPIILQRDGETLRGAGETTILTLADNVNCPAIIMGEPLNDPAHTLKNLHLSNLFIDGNRLHQQRELWRSQGEGSEIRNNGITVQDICDSSIEHVTCARCRSGGLVTTHGVRRLTVRYLTAFDNQFDGLACYLTEDSTFDDLFLHNNPGAGISLDLAFDHNTIANAVLMANDLGIFMRASSYNQFDDISIRGSHDYGVFMAQACEPTPRGFQLTPETECSNNSFTKFMATNCGGAAFRINDLDCTNNIIIGAQFDNPNQALSQVGPNLVTLK
jgi:Periplasmic copper-binding protein (NosD)